MYNNTTTISVGGNIGSGKSTQLQLCGTSYLIIPEPVETYWREGLNKMYSNPSRYFVCFQIQVNRWFNYHVPNILKAKKPKVAIIERSCFEGQHVFSTVARKNFILDEYQMTQLYVNQKKAVWLPKVYIYVKTSPEQCLHRIHKRQRECETTIDITFLRQLDNAHNELLKYLQQHGTKIHILNGNQAIDKVHKEFLAIVKKYV